MKSVTKHLTRRDTVASPVERFCAVGFGVALLIAVLAVVPVQSRYIGSFTTFFQTYAATLGTIEILTGLLLLWRAYATDDGRAAVLAGAYLFSAPLVLANTATINGALFPSVHFGHQAAAIIWLAWQFGFASTLLFFAYHGAALRVRAVIVPIVALGAAACCVLLALLVPNIPKLVNIDGSYTPLNHNLNVALVLINALTFAILMRRAGRLSSLEVWVSIAVLAVLADGLTFNVLLPLRRFTLGFYFSRTLLIISGVIVFAAICGDYVRLIRRADDIDGYAAVTEQLPVITFIVDERHSCLFVNPAWHALTGQSVAEALDFGYLRAVHGDDIDTITHGCKPDEDCRIRFLDAANGAYRRHLLRTVPLSNNSAVGQQQFMLIALDIEDSARAEAAQYASELRLKTFLDIIPQLVWTTDASGAVDWYNPAWYTFTGQADLESLGWGWQAVHHPDDLSVVVERWSESLRLGQPFEMELRLRRYDGSFHWFLTTAVPLRDRAGSIVAWFGSQTNIDAQKRESERSNRIARVLQEAFLPERLPNVAGVRIDAVYRPAEAEGRVGGDWYDALALPDGRVLVSCGDVVGHGLGAATLAGRYRQSIAVTGVENPDPGEVIRRVNRIAMLQEDGIATAIVAVLDPDSRLLTYALAGHPGPIVASPDADPTALIAGDLPLGVAADGTWSTRTLQLMPGSLVVLYTDGITEFARDAMSAEEQLRQAVNDLVHAESTLRPASAIMERVLAGCEPSDDIAILVLRCSDSQLIAETIDPAAFVRSWHFHSSDAFTAHTTRIILTEFLTAHASDPGATFEAELVIGEIIANTVEHAPGLVEIQIDWTGQRPVFTARDSGPGLDDAVHPDLAEALSENGRGLFLIHALAQFVTVQRAPGYGTEIRCTLPVSRDVGAAHQAETGDLAPLLSA